MLPEALRLLSWFDLTYIILAAWLVGKTFLLLGAMLFSGPGDDDYLISIGVCEWVAYILTILAFLGVLCIQYGRTFM